MALQSEHALRSMGLLTLSMAAPLTETTRWLGVLPQLAPVVRASVAYLLQPK
jgi:hypothetical protein